jgi:DNA-binding transcriptional LysR family regulator
MRLSLDHLQAFAAVIDLGSFSAAAERLRLTQPAVSFRIRQLEQRFGVRLVERVGKRAMPTAAGSELLAHARRIEAASAEAVAQMALHAAGGAGRVRLGADATACVYLLPPVLVGLRERHPALEIAVRTGDTDHILRSIDENALDAGLVTLPAAGRMFEVTPVFEDELVLIAPADQALPSAVTPAAMPPLPLVLYAACANTQRLVDAWLARGDAGLRPMMELGSVEAVKEVVGEGFGCAILPGMVMERGPADARIATRALSPRLHRMLALVVRRDKPLHAALRETIKALRTLQPSR